MPTRSAMELQNFCWPHEEVVPNGKPNVTNGPQRCATISFIRRHIDTYLS